MRPVPSPLLRRLIVLFAALLAAVIAAPTAVLASHPTIQQRFRADSGDRCQYGYTEGVLAWRAVHLPEVTAVDISGVVVDRPIANEPSLCPDDRRYTIAYFTGYVRDVVLDQQARRVENGSLDFRLTLGLNSTTARPIDRVVVEVCRVSLVANEPIYCGLPQTYYPSRFTPQG